jgi:hypothetical protein
MSRSNNTELKNPAVRFFEWSGSQGKIKSFDKSKGEQGENVFFDLPFTFLVLDTLTCIAGYSDLDQSGYWSNEIRNVTTDKLIVRTKKGTVAEGLYKDMTHILNKGAAYCQSVYIAYKEEGQLVIGNIKLSGSAIGAWIEFRKKNKIYELAVTIKEAKPEQKGITHYFSPVYTASPASEETNKQAVELDKELQDYLNKYFNRGTIKEADKHYEPVEDFHAREYENMEANHILGDGSPEPPDDLPF